MGPDDIYGKARPRKPSFRGVVYAYVSNDRVKVAKWPEARRKGHRTALNEREDWFLQAQWSTKFWAPTMQVQCAESVKGTPLMPRDIMTMIMAGRAWYWVNEDGKKVFPIVARNDVSDSLDMISQEPGVMLFRGSNYWGPIAPGAPGYVLTFENLDDPPQWKPNTAPTGGADWVLDTEWEFSVDGPVPQIVSNNLDGVSQVMVVGRSVSASTGGWRVSHVSIDDGATWLTTAGDYVSSSDTGVPGNENSIYWYSTSNSAARTFFGVIEKINGNVAVRPVSTPQRVPTFILNAPTPINRVRLCNWNGSVAGNLNNGRVQIYKR